MNTKIKHVKFTKYINNFKFFVYKKIEEIVKTYVPQCGISSATSPTAIFCRLHAGFRIFEKKLFGGPIL